MTYCCMETNCASQGEQCNAECPCWAARAIWKPSQGWPSSHLALVIPKREGKHTLASFPAHAGVHHCVVHVLLVVTCPQLVTWCYWSYGLNCSHVMACRFGGASWVLHFAFLNCTKTCNLLAAVAFHWQYLIFRAAATVLWTSNLAIFQQNQSACKEVLVSDL